MFLALTSNKRFWKTDKNILFLGEWCKLYNKKEKLENFKNSTLKYHFNNPKKVNNDILYLDTLYEKCLIHLSKSLNEIHNKSYSERYWRIVIGLWLRAFIDAFYDRFECIKEAGNSKLVKETLICSNKDWTVKEFDSFSANDNYNLFLLSYIIKNLKCFKFSQVNLEKNTNKASQNETKIKWRLKNYYKHFKKIFFNPLLFVRQFLAWLLIELWPYCMKGFKNPIIFAGTSYLSISSFLKFCFILKTIPICFHGKNIFIRQKHKNESIRKKIKFFNANNDFEKLLFKLLPSQIPLIYLENYKEYNDQVIFSSPRPPQVIYTAFTMNFRRAFEFWAAYSMEKFGTKILVAQHGGCYGIGKHLFLEKHIIKAFDKYYPWSKNDLNKSSKIKGMPSFRLYTSNKKLIKSNQFGDIMWIATTKGRYKTYIESDICGPPMLDYFNQQEKFYKKLNKNVKEILVWRYFNDPWNDLERIKDITNNIKVQFGSKKQFWKNSDFLESLQKCRLAIHTANETTYLEALSSNFPSIIFWDKKFYQIRNYARPFINELVKNEILFFDPLKAANKVNQIYTDPLKWWQEKNVQKARQFFCERFAYTKQNLFFEWKKEINSFF